MVEVIIEASEVTLERVCPSFIQSVSITTIKTSIFIHWADSRNRLRSLVTRQTFVTRSGFKCGDLANNTAFVAAFVHVYGWTDESCCLTDVCIAAMVSNNATVLPFSFHIIYGAYRPRVQECFQLLWYKVVPRTFFPAAPLRGFQRGKATHAVIHALLFSWTITLISDRHFWCAEWQNKINS